MAVGDKAAPTVDATYTNPSYVSQHPWDHVDGAPFGTRGGMVVNHVFPADGEYVVRAVGHLRRQHALRGHRRLDRRRARRAHQVRERARRRRPTAAAACRFLTEPILVRAGQHKVAAAFVKRTEGPYEDLIRPHDWSYAGGGSGGAGITTLPHLRDMIVARPLQARPASRSRRAADDLHLPADLVGRGSARARVRSSRGWPPTRIAGRSPRPRWTA